MHERIVTLANLACSPSLGFNDKGESIPFQGGTNEEVVVELYDKLRPEKKEQYLKVYWWV